MCCGCADVTLWGQENRIVKIEDGECHVILLENGYLVNNNIMQNCNFRKHECETREGGECVGVELKGLWLV